MADIAWSDIVADAPQLADVSALGQVLIVDYVNNELSSDAFGGPASARYKLARILLAQHLGQIVVTRGDAGQTSSETVSAESMTVAYAQNSSGKSLDLTSYGVQLQLLIRTSARARTPIVI